MGENNDIAQMLALLHDLQGIDFAYGIRNIIDEIKHHFEMSPSAIEVLIFTGSKEISVKRNIARSKGFLKMMMNSFRK